MTTGYNPKPFWESRLQASFNLKGVGNIDFSERYNQSVYLRKKRCIESALQDISLSDKVVLDVGCGTGFFVKWYLEKSARVSGIDITNVAVENLRLKFPTADFKVQDITDLTYQPPDKKYDIVNVWDVLYHVVDDEAFTRALRNIMNSLQSGGLLLFTDFLGAPSDIRIADHVQGRSLTTYRKILEPNGFELIEIHPLFNHLSRPHFGRLDNYLGWFYFLLDNYFLTQISTNGLSLSLWQYRLS